MVFTAFKPAFFPEVAETGKHHALSPASKGIENENQPEMFLTEKVVT